MDFHPTEEQKLMQDTARKFARDRIAPLVAEDEPAHRAVAVGKACIDEAAVYAKERKQFGKPIGAFQMIQADLAEMYVEKVVISRYLLDQY